MYVSYDSVQYCIIKYSFVSQDTIGYYLYDASSQKWNLYDIHVSYINNHIYQTSLSEVAPDFLSINDNGKQALYPNLALIFRILSLTKAQCIA